jgi:hypothetical protein
LKKQEHTLAVLIQWWWHRGAGAAVWPKRRFLGLFLFLGAVGEPVVRASNPVPRSRHGGSAGGAAVWDGVARHVETRVAVVVVVVLLVVAVHRRRSSCIRR